MKNLLALLALISIGSAYAVNWYIVKEEISKLPANANEGQTATITVTYGSVVPADAVQVNIPSAASTPPVASQVAQTASAPAGAMATAATPTSPGF